MKMSNISELSAHFNCSQRTMKRWIKERIIPGVKSKGEKYIVSELAMPPYTEKRIRKDATAVRCAILKAALKHKSTCAKLFDIAPGIYNKYIKQLKTAELIEVLTDKKFPKQKFIITTLKTDQYFRDRGFFGKDGMLITITSKALEATVEGYIKANLD